VSKDLPLVLFVDADAKLQERFQNRFCDSMKDSVFARLEVRDQNHTLPFLDQNEVDALILDLFMPPPWVPIAFLLEKKSLFGKKERPKWLRPIEGLVRALMKKMIVPVFRMLVLLSHFLMLFAIRIDRPRRMYTGFGGFDLLFRLAGTIHAERMFWHDRIFVYSYLVHPASRNLKLGGEDLQNLMCGELNKALARTGAFETEEGQPFEFPPARFYAGPSSVEDSLDEHAKKDWARLVSDVRRRLREG